MTMTAAATQHALGDRYERDHSSAPHQRMHREERATIAGESTASPRADHHTAASSFRHSQESWNVRERIARWAEALNPRVARDGAFITITIDAPPHARHDAETLEKQGESAVCPLIGNRPGLWRPIAEGNRLAFDIPLAAVADHANADDERSPHDAAAGLAAALRWAEATHRGHRNGWLAPPREAVFEQLGDTPRTVSVFGAAREIVVESDGNRLALTCPIVTNIPADLPASRRAWLDELIRDARRQFRLVRIGLKELNGGANRGDDGHAPAANPAATTDEDDANRNGHDQSADAHNAGNQNANTCPTLNTAGSLVASIDLSEAPAELLESLLPVACDGLRWVVAWLTPSAAAIADTSVSSELLASAPAGV